MTDEQKELMRIAAKRVVDDTNLGVRSDPFALAWALHVVSHVKPLGRPLGDGAPRPPAPLPANLEAF